MGNRSCRLLQFNIITTKTYRLIIFHCLGEGRKLPGGCVIVWNLEPLASGGQSGPKLFPHVICQFLSAREKNSEQDLFCRGSSANLPRLHTCENKVPFWDFSRFAVTVYTKFSTYVVHTVRNKYTFHYLFDHLGNCKPLLLGKICVLKIFRLFEH